MIPTADHRPYRLNEAIHRVVATDCLVSYQANRYSVPARYVGKTVDLVVSEDTLKVYHQGQEVAAHSLSSGRFQMVIEKNHYTELFKKKKPLPPPALIPWPEVEVRPLAAYEEAALAAGGVR